MVQFLLLGPDLFVLLSKLFSQHIGCALGNFQAFRFARFGVNFGDFVGDGGGFRGVVTLDPDVNEARVISGTDFDHLLELGVSLLGAEFVSTAALLRPLLERRIDPVDPRDAGKNRDDDARDRAARCISLDSLDGFLN